MRMCIHKIQEPVLDPAGGVMSDLITQDPLWLPTVYKVGEKNYRDP